MLQMTRHVPGSENDTDHPILSVGETGRRGPGGGQSRVEQVIEIVDQLARCRHDEVAGLRPRQIHEDLMESSDDKVDDAAGLDLDDFRKDVMIRRAGGVARRQTPRSRFACSDRRRAQRAP
jgi:hypothetical protein